MKRLMLLGFLGVLCLSQARAAGVGLGGYVPFGMSTQKDADGGRDTFSLAPALGVSHAFYVPWLEKMLVPELGLVMHGTHASGDYSKNTIFALLDVRHPVHQLWALRYGVGLFNTRISGKGGQVSRRNGANFDNFNRPSRTVTSHNGTVNFGVELWLPWNASARLETFWFSLFDSESRDVSYMLGLNWNFWGLL